MTDLVGTNKVQMEAGQSTNKPKRNEAVGH